MPISFSEEQGNRYPHLCEGLGLGMGMYGSTLSEAEGGGGHYFTVLNQLPS